MIEDDYKGCIGNKVRFISKDWRRKESNGNNSLKDMPKQ